MTVEELREKYNILEYRSAERKTIEIRVKGPGKVEVRAPVRVSGEAVDRFILSHADWLEESFRKLSQNIPPPLSDDSIAVLKREALYDMTVRVKYYAHVVGVTYGRITIRSQHTRWGSCSKDGNLNFNCLLMLAPDCVRDYVVVHELCHRIEFNHSDRFWSEVERVLPKYKEYSNWLKENGAALMARLP